MQEPGLFDTLVGALCQQLSPLPDRRTGRNTRYQMRDAAISAFSVFFTQTPSFLADQRQMAARRGQSNAHSLFGVHQIPSDNQIRNLLDGVAPTCVLPVFEAILQGLEQQEALAQFRAVADTLLIALDGTEYFHLTRIHCPQYSTRTLQSGQTHYFHRVVTPVIVCPGQSQVIPLGSWIK